MCWRTGGESLVEWTRRCSDVFTFPSSPRRASAGALGAFQRCCAVLPPDEVSSPLRHLLLLNRRSFHERTECREEKKKKSCEENAATNLACPPKKHKKSWSCFWFCFLQWAAALLEWKLVVVSVLVRGFPPRRARAHTHTHTQSGYLH